MVDYHYPQGLPLAVHLETFVTLKEGRGGTEKIKIVRLGVRVN